MSRQARNWIALALGTVVALGASYAAYQLADYSWNQVVDYRGPYATVALPETTGPEVDLPEAKRAQPPRRVVYVIVDGLREDVSRRMPNLNALRDRGYDAVVRTSQPSLSFPTWTTLMSGAPQRISGVTTNWFEERVRVETIFDVALRDGATVAVSAPSDFELLFGVKRTPHVFLRDWEHGTYMTAEIVDNAIRLAEESSATLVLVHFPDIDNAGHYDGGGASTTYLDTALKCDADLGRLVEALQDDRTSFVVAADHGHIRTGGHAGWEDEVTRVPAVFAGAGVDLGAGEGTQDQVAPTVALLAGLPVPRNATGEPMRVSGPLGRADAARVDAQQGAAYTAYAAATVAGMKPAGPAVGQAREAFERATERRLATERGQRLPMSLLIAGIAIAVIVAIGVMSWRALVSALAGALGYYLVYNGLYFGLHHYGLWSLSSFNAEELLKGFMNARMIEAVIAGVVAAAIAADVYLFTRAVPRRPKGEHLPGWLALGTSTVLVIQATLALQVAWFLWRSGAQVSWYLPDFMWAFKYDLDLIQGTAVGAVALLAPVVTWVVGRYHPIRPKAAGDPGLSQGPAPTGGGDTTQA